MKNKKYAIVIFNLGGPDNLKAVRPFLFNLFYDPLIIRLLNPFRFLIAFLIAKNREKEAQHIYSQIGGKSPIVDQTRAQERALEKSLKAFGYNQVKVFTSMRYWHPFASETLEEVQDYAPDEIILLPLYPQFSSTTTKSFYRVWDQLMKIRKCVIPVKKVCCYPEADGFISQSVENIIQKYPVQTKSNEVHILLSAHGLPEKIVKSGDPYQFQCEQSARQIIEGLEKKLGHQVEYTLCYQSRVGPMKWIGPSTEDVIIEQSKKGKTLLVYPIAFVSEHSETLVEIDQMYRDLAKEKGAKDFIYAPTVQTGDLFITGLAQEAIKAIDSALDFIGPELKKTCCGRFKDCSFA